MPLNLSGKLATASGRERKILSIGGGNTRITQKNEALAAVIKFRYTYMLGSRPKCINGSMEILDRNKVVYTPIFGPVEVSE